ncbi:CDP-diacylglycerol--serine O-phosphatidyltransferase [Thermodesulfobacterium sp. TA1]|uniref:CDP-diacylglycerol--serine O-phosphatidyltransferase n=1 Tax=Thermodesulfobacterium sp. TA1 TaxID=2234087 RepID=UPI001232C0ED|nr:CDP-diacylglycerol--serine O-phosphatidyltransferase [Thermodesulfobacterium sp. TA1]QER41610.1 CDP-diacylglycerol--serine O-phosphatidyltransferase [Thermodesulfobacterium sp. TA1]
MIALVPNIFTTFNLLFGFYSIISSINGDFTKAGWAIFLAIIFDVFDGRIARYFNQTTKFGLEYDSLSDLISFGVAPAILIYQFVLAEFGKIGWLTCFLYTTCVALRLARYNVKTHSGLGYFEGLPSPAGAAILASSVLFIQAYHPSFEVPKWAIITAVSVISYLLVSPIQYPSFKDIKIKKAQSFYLLLLFVGGLTIAASNPSYSLFILVIIYTLLGPVLFLRYKGAKVVKKIRKRKDFGEKLTK